MHLKAPGRPHSARRLGPPHLPRALDGPMHFVAILLCMENHDFAATYMRTSGAQSAVAIPTPTMPVLTLAIADLLSRANTTRGIVLRDATQGALSTLVLGP